MSHDLKLKTILEMEHIPLEDIWEEMDSPPAHHQEVNVLSRDFVEFMKYIENDAKKGFKQGKWFPHDSYEGGYPTIAWGHKIKTKSEESRLSRGITEGEAEQLLKNDIREAQSRLKRYMDSQRVKIPLSQKQAEMLTEFIFNLGGLEKFPKFTRAVLNQDWKTAEKESIRYAKGKPIDRRNQIFAQRYFR
jgi:GH24 family phage-related lysozyme (muramidase)